MIKLRLKLCSSNRQPSPLHLAKDPRIFLTLRTVISGREDCTRTQSALPGLQRQRLLYPRRNPHDGRWPLRLMEDSPVGGLTSPDSDGAPEAMHHRPGDNFGLTVAQKEDPLRAL